MDGDRRPKASRWSGLENFGGLEFEGGKVGRGEGVFFSVVCGRSFGVFLEEVNLDGFDVGVDDPEFFNATASVDAAFAFFVEESGFGRKDFDDEVRRAFRTSSGEDVVLF